MAPSEDHAKGVVSRTSTRTRVSQKTGATLGTGNTLHQSSSHFIRQEDDLQIKIIGPNNEEITPEDIVIPPDGGWGWVIVFAAFMSNLIVDGTILSFGLLSNEIVANKTEIDDMGNVVSPTTGGDTITVTDVAWAGGILAGFYLGTGPFVSIIANAFGFRVTAISGAIVSFIGFILAWYFNQDGPNKLALFLCYGFVGGVGLCLLYVPSIITVGFYFEKKRAVATGIAVCGSGVGTFVFAPMTGFLLKKFGWQDTILVQAFIMLSAIFFVSLYRPLKTVKQKMALTAKPSTNVGVTSAVEGDAMRDYGSTQRSALGPADTPGPVIVKVRRASEFFPQLSGTATKTSVSVRHQDDEQPLATSSNSAQPEATPGSDAMTTTELYQNTNRDSSNSMAVEDDSLKGSQRKTQFSAPSVYTASNDLDGDTFRGQGSILTNRDSTILTEATGAKSVATTVTLVVDEKDAGGEAYVYRVASQHTLNKPLYKSNIFYAGAIHKLPEHELEEGHQVEWHATPVTELETLEVQEGKKCKPCRCSFLRNMMDFSLMKSCTFSLLAVSGGFSFLGFYVPFMFLPSIATKNEISPENASYLIAAIGVANTLGRVLCGLIADRMSSRVLLINNLALTFAGLATVMVPEIGRSFSGYIAYALVFGLGIACFISLRSILVVELIGLSKLTNAIGLILLFEGLAAFFGGPLAGMLKDMTEDFDMSFRVAGALMLVSGVMCYPLHIINGWEKRRRLQKAMSRMQSNA